MKYKRIFGFIFVTSLSALTFILSSCTCKHNFVQVDYIESTCTSTGKITYKCSECEEINYEILDAKGHKEVIDEEIYATCVQTGLSQGIHCEVCDEVIVKQIEIPVKEHDMVNNICSFCQYPYVNGFLFEYSKDYEGYIITDCILDEKEIIIPSTYENELVVGLQGRVFSSCYNLESIVIPSTIKSLSCDALIGLQNLSNILVDKDNEVYDSRDNCNAIIETKTNTLIVGCNNTVIPNSVKIIGSNAFRELNSLIDIEIPEGIEIIGGSAFNNCVYLERVKLPNGLKIIDECAFFSCLSLKTVETPDTLEFIGKRAFYYCGLLESINIPDGVTEIGSMAFYSCGSLKSIVVPNSVKNIGIKAFMECNSLENISIPFTGKSRSESNKIDKKFYYIFGASVPDSLKKVRITDDEYIGEDSFEYCETIECVEILNGVTRIGQYAFRNCSSIKELSLPITLISIGNNAFSNCSSLESIEIPEGVRIIDDYAFYYCSSLKSIKIPSSVEKIGYNILLGCSALLSIDVDDNNKVYDSRENCNAIIETQTHKLICTSMTTIIPDGIKIINHRAFAHQSQLVSIVIPEGVEVIDNMAFYSCTSLKSID